MSDSKAAANIGWLPIDVVRDIAARLPVKSLLRFKAVSKWWRRLISDSSFVDQHQHLANNNSQHQTLAIFIETLNMFDDHSIRLVDYIINYDHVSYSIQKTSIEHRIMIRVVDTSSSNSMQNSTELKPVTRSWLFNRSRYFSYCRGIFMMGMHSFSLWNPSTREKKEIPKSPMGREENPRLEFRAAGLGYDSGSSTNDTLKVVLAWIGPNNCHPQQIVIEVYDVKTSTWTCPSIEYDACSWTDNFYGFGYGVTLANGSVCWGSKDKVVCFDVGMNRLMEVPLLLPLMQGEYYQVLDMGGCLGLAIQRGTGDVGIWIMKEFGVEESWIKLMDISSGSRRHPICFAKNGEVLVSKECDQVFFVGNLKDEIKFPKLWLDRGCTSYVESLVSLYTQNHEETHQ